MIEPGDIRLADLRDEERRAVLVVSNDRFHRAGSRALIAPAVPFDPDREQFPWRIVVGDRVFAIDLLRSIGAESLLERLATAPPAQLALARRALQAIT